MWVCPKCSRNEFRFDPYDEDLAVVIWNCGHCSYKAIDHTNLHQVCRRCGDPGMLPTQCHLDDAEKVYWWCYGCDSITPIKDSDGAARAFFI